jgi:hypothetical protein
MRVLRRVLTNRIVNNTVNILFLGQECFFLTEEHHPALALAFCLVNTSFLVAAKHHLIAVNYLLRASMAGCSHE